LIKNIIFDFGGVLYDLDISGAVERFSKLFQLKVDQCDFPEPYKTILDEYEMGLFSEGSWMHRLQRTVPHIVTERQILDTWNSMLVNLPKERLDFILNLRNHYKVYLLSNTNTTHIQYMHRVELPSIGVADFEHKYFERVFYSHEINMRKPNRNIYEYVLNQTNMVAAESLFIDDNADNIAAARHTGLCAQQHDPAKEIMQELQNYIDHWGGT
jgi:putative hydrolase of the HAD superfamily